MTPLTDRMLAAEVMITKRLRSGWRTRHKAEWDTMERAAETMKLAGFAQALRAIRSARFKSPRSTSTKYAVASPAEHITSYMASLDGRKHTLKHTEAILWDSREEAEKVRRVLEKETRDHWRDRRLPEWPWGDWHRVVEVRDVAEFRSRPPAY